MDGCTVVQTGAGCQRVGSGESRLRERILLITFDDTGTAEGMGGRSSAVGNTPGESTHCLGSEVQLLSIT